MSGPRLVLSQRPVRVAEELMVGLPSLRDLDVMTKPEFNEAVQYSADIFGVPELLELGVGV